MLPIWLRFRLGLAAGRAVANRGLQGNGDIGINHRYGFFCR